MRGSCELRGGDGRVRGPGWWSNYYITVQTSKIVTEFSYLFFAGIRIMSVSEALQSLFLLVPCYHAAVRLSWYSRMRRVYNIPPGWRGGPSLPPVFALGPCFASVVQCLPCTDIDCCITSRRSSLPDRQLPPRLSPDLPLPPHAWRCSVCACLLPPCRALRRRLLRLRLCWCRSFYLQRLYLRLGNVCLLRLRRLLGSRVWRRWRSEWRRRDICGRKNRGRRSYDYWSAGDAIGQYRRL